MKLLQDAKKIDLDIAHAEHDYSVKIKDEAPVKDRKIEDMLPS